jgi:opacity protein-like surface antigen
MASKASIGVIAALALLGLGGCASQQAMTSEESKPLAQAPERAPQEVKTPLPPQTISREPAPSPAPAPAPARGLYVAAQVGYSDARSANFKEDNPGAADCFLFTTATSCGGTLNSLGSSAVFGVSVGYRFSPMFRADVSYQQRSGYDLSGWDPAGTYFDPKVKSDSVMVSGFLDFPYKIAGRVQPYAGVAIGRSRNTMEALNWNDPTCCTGTLNPGGSHTSTAWQLTLGAAITLVDKLVLDLGYRYTDLGKFEKPMGSDQVGDFNGTGTTTSATGKLRANEFLIGLRYDFF